MLELMNYALQNGVTLVVDEAFMDFMESESILKEAVQATNIICLRAFTKFFGMPGLRVGYAVSDEATIAALRQGPGTLDREHTRGAGRDRRADGLGAQPRRRADSSRRSETGCSKNSVCCPALRHFRAPRTSSSSNSPRQTRIRSGRNSAVRGILVRDCSTFPGLDSRYIRIAVRTRRENSRLIRALRKLLIPKSKGITWPWKKQKPAEPAG